MFDTWTTLVTRIISGKSEEFRSAACLAALKKELGGDFRRAAISWVNALQVRPRATQRQSAAICMMA